MKNLLKQLKEANEDAGNLANYREHHSNCQYKITGYPEECDCGLKRESALRMVGKGWAEMINNLYDAKPKGVVVTQVKEKFGGLRFYVYGSPEWYDDLISYYEDRSYKVCEVCGKPGELRDDLGWILTLCSEHYKEEMDKRSQ